MAIKRDVCLVTAALLTGIVLCAPAQAQQMYRCGNKYQDRPCDGAKQGKVIGSTGSSQSSSGPAVDANCARRGADAQKIMWAKESGRTEEMQLSATTSADAKALISDVYRRRGSSAQVRAAVEADCAAEQEKAAQAAALAGAAAKLQPQNQSAAAPIPAAESRADLEKEAARQREKQAANDAAQKKRRCDNLGQMIERVRNRQRVGGNTTIMEMANRERQDLEKEYRDAGC